MKRIAAAPWRRAAFFAAAVGILGNWDQASQAAGQREEAVERISPVQVPSYPVVDPNLPSTRLPGLPERKPLTPAESLQLPEKPLEPPKAGPGQPGSIVLSRVTFEGNQIIPTADLDEVAKPYLNRRLSGSDLVELRHKLTLLYVDRGYINSGAVIPEQTVDTGELRVQIVEGRLNQVRITDITDQTSEYRLWPLRDRYIRDRLIDDPEEPLNVNELQDRYLLLLNDRLIERLNGSLLPGLRPGEAVLDLKVTRARPYGGYLGVDNFSPPQIGSYTGRLGFWLDNMLTLGERVDFNMSPTGGSFSYNTGIDIPLSATGTRFAFRYTNADTVLVEEPFASLNIVNNVVSYDGQISQPVLWDTKQKLTLGANFAVRQNTETIDGTPLDLPGSENGKTQATVVRTWQDYLHQGTRFEAAFRSTFSVGIDALGATVTDNEFVGDGRFFAWLGQAVGRYRFLSNGAYVALSGAVQTTPDELLALEKIAVGGFSSVRGYRQNYLVRDQGFFVSLEVAYPLYGGEPGSKHGLFLIPFTDYGGAWDQGQETTYLQSIGLGMEWHYQDLSAALYYAARLTGYDIPEGADYTAQDNGISFQVNWHSF